MHVRFYPRHTIRIFFHPHIKLIHHLSAVPSLKYAPVCNSPLSGLRAQSYNLSAQPSQRTTGVSNKMKQFTSDLSVIKASKWQIRTFQMYKHCRYLNRVSIWKKLID
jgi:hypothetical protein